MQTCYLLPLQLLFFPPSPWLPTSRDRRHALNSFLRLLLIAMILLAVLNLCSCTSAPSIPQLQAPQPVAPAECRKAAFEAFAPGLEGLPIDWLQRTPRDRARTILTITADDGEQYQKLRAQAVRCAPDQ